MTPLRPLDTLLNAQTCLVSFAPSHRFFFSRMNKIFYKNVDTKLDTRGSHL